MQCGHVFNSLGDKLCELLDWHVCCGHFDCVHELRCWDLSGCNEAKQLLKLPSGKLLWNNGPFYCDGRLLIGDLLCGCREFMFELLCRNVPKQRQPEFVYQLRCGYLLCFGRPGGSHCVPVWELLHRGIDHYWSLHRRIVLSYFGECVH